MKFDPDLARAILLKAVATPSNRPTGRVVVDGYTQDEVFEHIEYLRDRGYVDAKILLSGMGGARIAAAHITRLTNEGQEFLAAANDDTRWNRAKDQIASKGDAMTLESLKAALTGPPPSPVVYNLYGTGSRVAVNSVDNSTNVVNVNSETLFSELADAIRAASIDEADRQRILEAVTAMSRAPAGPPFAERYASFVSLAANHMQLVGPFLPALAQLLIAAR